MPDPHADNARMVLVPTKWNGSSLNRKTRKTDPYWAPDRIQKAIHNVGPIDFERQKDLSKEGIHWDTGFASFVKHGSENIDERSVELNSNIESKVTDLIANKKLVGVVGGEHSVSLGSIRAHADAYRGLTVLNISAYANMRHTFDGLKYSRSCVMKNVLDETAVHKMIHLGVRDLSKEEYECIGGNSNVYMIPDTGEAPINRNKYLSNQVVNMITGNHIAVASSIPVYVSMNMNGFEHSLAPHTLSPVPGGFSWHVFCQFMLELSNRVNIVGFDLVETGTRNWDVTVAARTLYKLIGATMYSEKVSH